MSETNVAGPGAPPEVSRAQLLKLVVEMGPLASFFLANWLGGIFWATGTFMVATVAALMASRALFGRIPVMPMVSGVVVIVFGGLTLLLADELFIKLKPTIVNVGFAFILLGGLAFDRLLLRYVLDEVFSLTEEGWRVLTIRWACFFLFLALLNEIVWRLFSTDTWVSFKVFGVMPLTMIFAVAQIGLLKRFEAPRQP